jgi:hypothetical protein
VLAESAFTHLLATVTACMDAGIFAPGDPMPVTLELWAAAHGIASLMLAKPFLPWGEKMETANRVLRAAALGRAVNDLEGGEMSPEDVTAWLASQRRRKRRG